jgi:hypothetical protein
MLVIMNLVRPELKLRSNLPSTDQLKFLNAFENEFESFNRQSDAFGGDRNQMTLLGHSAGAASVLYHLISPRTNLFVQR